MDYRTLQDEAPLIASELDYEGEEDVDEGDIDEAFRSALFEYHPDHGGDEDKFSKLQDQYEELDDHVKDESRKRSFQPREAFERGLNESDVDYEITDYQSMNRASHPNQDLRGDPFTVEAQVESENGSYQLEIVEDEMNGFKAELDREMELSMDALVAQTQTPQVEYFMAVMWPGDDPVEHLEGHFERIGGWTDETIQELEGLTEF